MNLIQFRKMNWVFVNLVELAQIELSLCDPPDTQ